MLTSYIEMRKKGYSLNLHATQLSYSKKKESNINI